MTMAKTIVTTALCLGLVGCVAPGMPSSEELDEQLAGKADFWGEGEGARIMADHAFTDTTMDAAAITKFLTETRESWRGPSFLATYEVDGQPFAAHLQEISEEYVINPLLLLTFMQTQTGLVSKTETPSDAELGRALGCSARGQEVDSLDGQIRCAAALLRGAFDDAGALEATVAGYRLDVVHPRTGTSPNNRATAAIYTYTTDGELFFLVWNQFVRHYFEQIEGDPLDWLRLPYAEGFIGGACNTNDDCVFEGGICRTAANGKNVCTKTCDEGALCPDRVGYPVTLCVAGETAGMAPGGGFCMPRCLADDLCGDGFSCQHDVARYGSSTYTRNACVAHHVSGGAPDPNPAGTTEDRAEERPEATPEETPDPTPGDATWSILVTRIVGSEASSEGVLWDGYLANYTPDLGALLWVSDDPECTWANSSSRHAYNTHLGCADYDWTREYGTDTLDARLNLTLFNGSEAMTRAQLENGLNIQIRDHDWDGAKVMTECTFELEGGIEQYERAFTVECGAGQDTTGAVVPHRIELQLIRHPG
jgi:hypothetical protein